MQFKEESLLITARQLSIMDTRVLLFLDVFGALSLRPLETVQRE
jgi:hypothetical protein